MSKDFKDFVTAIGECKSKQEEDRIIMKEMCAPIPILFALSALPASSEAGGNGFEGAGPGRGWWGCAAPRAPGY